MRVKKLGVGVVLAAAIMLTGCSAPTEAPASDKPAADKPAATESEAPSEAQDATCPELTEGATINGAELGGCIATVTQDVSGYAAKTTTMGIESTARYNPSADAIATTSQLGEVIIIGDNAWVKTLSSDWQVADSTSSDPLVAGLSMGAEGAKAADLATMAAAMNGEFTVTGTGERLGQKVFVLSGTVTVDGVSSETVYEVTSDYAVFASTSSTEAAGQTVEVKYEVTEWDVAQDITAPM